MAYLEGVGIAPFQSVENAQRASFSILPDGIDPALLEELWRESDAAACGVAKSEFDQILQRVGTAQNYGLAEGETPSRRQQTAFFRGLKLADLVLARACASGKEPAWERFLALYRQPLVRAAIAITGGDTLGRDLADQLYAELFGLATRDGERRCPLDSYRGRGSLMGWLRTTLAQRHVDHHRRSHREQPLEEFDAPAPNPEPEKPLAELTVLGKAIEEAFRWQDAEDRFLLAAHYLDGRTLLEIGRVLAVHEATVSRRLRRATDGIRKQVLKNLQRSGMSRRAAEEALGTDPRDLDLNLKNLLQNSQSGAFQEKAAR
ncbi:MAG: sigma factor-like helix-turn-helix DNA-binding protein [Terracidiphilus sp.]